MNAKQLVMIKHHRSQTKPWHGEDETAEQIHTHAGKNIIKKKATSYLSSSAILMQKQSGLNAKAHTYKFYNVFPLQNVTIVRQI